MAQQRILGKAGNLIGTTLDKSESVIYEGLTSIELGFQSLTNTMEEVHNDSIEDVINSRLRVATTLKRAQTEAKELGFTEEEIQTMFTIDRR